MSRLKSRPVDPRDQRWEVWQPRYRVYFWSNDSPAGPTSREFEISDADVVEVLGWAEEHAEDGESFTVFAIAGDGDGLGLLHLAGEDPTRARDT